MMIEHVAIILSGLGLGCVLGIILADCYERWRTKQVLKRFLKILKSVEKE
jgi:hypothetical protein